jgi:RNA polymerase sigma factor (sigma-70 family)
MRDFKIRVKNEIVSVSEEIYVTYYKMGRRERYLEEIHSAKNLSFDHLMNMDYPVEEKLFEPACSLEELIAEKIMKQSVRQALELLSEHECMIVREIFYKGTSIRELSENLSIPKSTLHEQKERILKKLRKIIKDI